SATILGDQLDARREQLRNNLPIQRVVGPADIAALAVHLMTNTAVTGATFDIDGGQQLVEQGARLSTPPEKTLANVTYDEHHTALLVIDPYNDFISEGGKVWNRLKAVAEANG